MDNLGMLIFILIVFSIYFAPTIVAYARKVPDLLSIGILNFFLGWSFIGWVVALAWATRNQRV